ncbi:MAG: type II toxin-antitoxin system MqsA family antitoxin [Deltaproteobacteria bacterium]|nr:type II toxin-antitoxin system MqsA family antitoxin [Deltaproteobacteria bacterium]
MSRATRTLQVSSCPSCGSTAIRAVRGDWSGSYRGKRYVVKDLQYFQCPRCGEKVYEPRAMRRIQAASPAFAKRHRARKSA